MKEYVTFLQTIYSDIKEEKILYKCISIIKKDIDEFKFKRAVTKSKALRFYNKANKKRSIRKIINLILEEINNE